MMKSDARGKGGADNDDDGFDQGGSTGRSRAVDHDPDAPSIHNEPAKTYGKTKKASAKDKKTITDTKRGRAQDGYQVEVGDDKNIGHNEKKVDPAFLREAVNKVMADEAEAKAIMDEARLRCEPLRNSIKVTKKAAVKSGAHLEELNTLLRKVKTELKLATITEKLAPDQKDHFRTLEKALGPSKDLPLFKAALERAHGAVH